MPPRVPCALASLYDWGPTLESASVENTSVEQEVYSLLIKVFVLLDDCDRRFFARYGLSTRQFLALQHLDLAQGRSMVDLSRLLLTIKSNVTGIVDNLEGKGLVRRTSVPEDRRVALITLTPEGRRLRALIMEQHGVLLAELLGILGDERLRLLLDLLRPLSHAIERQLDHMDSKPLAVTE